MSFHEFMARPMECRYCIERKLVVAQGEIERLKLAEQERLLAQQHLGQGRQ